MKKQFFLSLFVIPALLHSETSSGEYCCEPGLIVGEPVLCDQIPAIFPYPASVEFDCKRDIYVTGDFIYWKAYSNGAQIAIKNTPTGGTRLLYIKDEYRPGFKAGLGIDLGSLVLDVQYIWWHHSYKTHFTAGAGESITPFSLSQVLGVVFVPGFTEVRSLWKYHFDQVLISFQRPLYFGTRLVVNGLIGLIGDWVKEKTLINGFNEVFGPAPGNNGFVFGNFKRWSLGPAIGLHAKALGPCGFRFIGNLDLNLTYLQWKGKSTLSFPPVDPGNPFANSTEKYKHPVDYWKAGAATQIGFAWERYIWDGCYHVYLGVTYDAIATWSIGVPAFDHVLRFDPTLHGWTLEARFDF